MFYNSWTETLLGVQYSVLGPLFFNIFRCNLFMAISHCDIVNYGADNTRYSTGKNC